MVVKTTVHHLLSFECYNHTAAKHQKVSMETRKDYCKENL